MSNRAQTINSPVIEPFIYSAQPSRVIFGSGTLSQLPDEVDRLGLSRVMIIVTPQQHQAAAELAEKLGHRVAAIFAEATMHTPVEVTERAMAVVRDKSIDGLVAVGGGSTTGLAKAIAFRTDLPQIISPTTYAGSEMTSILGETENNLKTTKSDPKILPEVVIYDVDLTLSLPGMLSVTSGINAIAHAVEALYAHNRNPVISLIAEEGIRALASALPTIAANTDDRQARTNALYGAWLCGISLGSVGMAIHHKLCHTLGGTFNLPHAETHTIVLPHAVAYNSAAAPEAMGRIARALNTPNAATGLYDLAAGLTTTMALKDLGMTEDGIDMAANIAMKNVYPNPRPLERDAIRNVIASAWAGTRPTISD